MREIVCPDCGKTKQHHALELCYPCWYRQWKRKWRERNKEHCLIVERAQAKRWYAANPDKRRAQNQRRYQKQKTRRLSILAEQVGAACIECGEDRAGAIEYHHTKKKEAGNLYAMSWHQFRIELPKLVALCGTCHNLKHH